MKKLFMTLLLLPLIGAVIAQDDVIRDIEDYESVRYAVFYEGTNSQTSSFESEKLDKMGKWLIDNKDQNVIVTGWAEPTKNEAVDKAVAKKRAEAAKSYLMRKFKIAEDRITINEGGIDKDNIKTGISRRVDFSVIAQREIYFPHRVSKDPAPETVSEQTPKQTASVMRKDEILVVKGGVVHTDETVAAAMDKSDSACGSFYLGVGAGTAFGISTFSTATQDGITPSIAAQIFVGYKFTPVVSAELAFGYTKLEMQSPDLFDDVYYGNNQRILVIPSSYSYPIVSYSDLTSYTSLYSATVKVNFDITAINNKAAFKRWAFLTTPKVGFIYSDAIVEDGAGVEYIADKSTHVSMGLDLSAVYSFNESYGLRLTTGGDYVTGSGLDAMPQADVKSNFIWATNLNFIISF